VCPAESKLVFRIFVKKSSNINQKTPHKRKPDLRQVFFCLKPEGGIRKPEAMCGVKRRTAEARPERLVSDEHSEERDLATRGRISHPLRTGKIVFK
ncbi:MAG: hypothetical protein WC928_04290, partial [Patescibacteria group bacterium]